jgi:hypothetical protein
MEFSVPHGVAHSVSPCQVTPLTAAVPTLRLPELRNTTAPLCLPFPSRLVTQEMLAPSELLDLTLHEQLGEDLSPPSGR